MQHFFYTSTKSTNNYGTIVILYPGLLSLNSNASCRYFVTFSFLLDAIFACCGHAISQIQIFFFSLSSNTKSGLLDVVVFHKLNSKSQTNLALLFSKTCKSKSQIQIFFFSLSSNTKSGLLDVVVFRKLNSKSQTNLALLFSKTALSPNFPYTTLFLFLLTRIPLPMQLPSPLMLFCVVINIHCWLSSYIQQQDAQRFH